MQFILLVAAALFTLVIRKFRNRRVAILWLAVACYTAVHMLFYVIFRYREPILPVLAVLASLTIETLIADRFRAKLPSGEMR